MLSIRCADGSLKPQNTNVFSAFLIAPHILTRHKKLKPKYLIRKRVLITAAKKCTSAKQSEYAQLSWKTPWISLTSLSKRKILKA